MLEHEHADLAVLRVGEQVPREAVLVDQVRARVQQVDDVLGVDVEVDATSLLARRHQRLDPDEVLAVVAAQGHPAPLVGRAVLQTQCPSPETAHPIDVVCVDDEFAISGQVHALHGNGCDTRPNNRGLCVSLGIVLEEPIG
ncbi:hypothetical protein GCM10025862_33740 [Arsenicicoccus piscis]|uniref:Uncharacterized protein n=1 Tax=Arsenicicoccus piscis TaxID=673954 RepID=A0ABQ6HUI4_9MICO|nr:hypothetical protein [Arsenicicoccus piscis]GMA21353.1 hypothetical protein GCM10025862_33740 [Arsenicicoccus piscis]